MVGVGNIVIPRPSRMCATNAQAVFYFSTFVLKKAVHLSTFFKTEYCEKLSDTKNPPGSGFVMNFQRM